MHLSLAPGRVGKVKPRPRSGMFLAAERRKILATANGRG